MNKDVADIVKEHALRAVEDLTAILFKIQEHCSEEDFNSIRRGVGSSLGRIQVDLLSVVYAQYPEMDDLKER